MKDVKFIFEEIKKAKANAKRDATEVYKLRINIEKMEESIQSIQSETKQILASVVENKTYTDESKSKVVNHLNEIEALIPKISETNKSARELESKIEQHHDAFDTFDSEMETRIRASKEGQTKLAKVLNDFEALKGECKIYCDEKKQEVESIIDRATEMLGISTSAGLGETFKKQATARGDSAKFHYMVMLLSLFIVAIVGFWAAQGIVGEGGVDWSKLLIKIAIIVPFAVLASISIKTVRTLEKSKEHYEHKTAVSYAVEGYRKLFIDEEEQTNLLKDTVREILKDPSDGLKYPDGEDATVLGILERFANIFVKIMDSKKK